MTHHRKTDTNLSPKPHHESTLLPMLVGGLALALVGMTVIVIFV